MHRLVLALAGLTMVVCAESAWAGPVPVDAYAGLDPIYPVEACVPFPPWYPSGWEIVVHTPCPPGYYLPHYFHHAYYRYWPSHHHYGPRPLHHHVAYVLGSVHRRPYLRPGWWW